jgi:hypothetical protein
MIYEQPTKRSGQTAGAMAVMRRIGSQLLAERKAEAECVTRIHARSPLLRTFQSRRRARREALGCTSAGHPLAPRAGKHGCGPAAAPLG